MHPLRSALAAAPVGLLAFTLSPAVSPAQADHVHGAPGPIHAGNTFGWYQFGVFRQEFVGPKPGFWKQKGRGVVRTQNGRGAATAQRVGMEWVGETEKYYDLRLQVYRLRKGELDVPTQRSPTS